MTNGSGLISSQHDVVRQLEELEASVPLSQLHPSVSFNRCTAHLTSDADQLHGDELVLSLESGTADIYFLSPLNWPKWR